MKPAIVVVAYNRPESLKRILSFISLASYHEEDINLIISIDKFKNDKDRILNNEVLKIAKEYNWKYGTKKVIHQEKNLGLRSHMLKCGDLTEKYGSIILLEDDLGVSPQFYNYTLECLNFYSNDNKIGGISLYNHLTNVNTKLPFIPIEDDSDVYFLQFASSWGQAWSYEQWSLFREWYNKEKESKSWESVPEFVKGWPKSSWLKYFIKYLIEKDLFFVYPKKSLTTNFTDEGEHHKIKTKMFQVPLFYNEEINFKFKNIDKSLAKYDSFFESIWLKEHIEKKYNRKVVVDFYNTKKEFKELLLTTRKLNFKILEQYALDLKPYELNVYYSLFGNSIKIYDTLKKEKNTFLKFNYYKYLCPYLIFESEMKYFIKIKKIVKKGLKKWRDTIGYFVK